jgi:hypothetical protein
MPAFSGVLLFRKSPTLLFLDLFSLAFSYVSFAVMLLLCFYYVTCLCCSLLNPIHLGFELFVSGVDFFIFSFWFLFGNFFSTVTLNLNFHGFFGSLFRCLLGVFELLMVVSIRLRRDKSFFGLHLHITAIFTSFEEFVDCLDWVYCLNSMK